MTNTDKATIQKKLTPKQSFFCELYSTNREYFGNGLQAYAKAYNIDLSEKGKIGTAKANAHRLLTNADILAHIRKLLDLGGLCDEQVDKELLFLIQQNSNFTVKLGAIKEYNSLRKRIIETSNTKVEVNLSTVLKDIKNKSIEELQQMA